MSISLKGKILRVLQLPLNLPVTSSIKMRKRKMKKQHLFLKESTLMVNIYLSFLSYPKEVKHYVRIVKCTHGFLLNYYC